MKKQLKSLLVSAVAFSLIVPTVSAPVSEAASKPKLAKKSVSVKVGKTKKIKVKSKKKVKKTTWKLTKAGKKIVKLSKKKKKSVTVKGKKAGKATLTAKIKVGKKTYKAKCKIKVKATTTVVSTTEPTATASSTSGTSSSDDTATATPRPTLRVLTQEYKSASAPTQQDSDVFPTTPPSLTIDDSEKYPYTRDYEDYVVGTKTQDAIEGDGIGGAVLRGCDSSNDTGNDYLEVVDGSTVLDENGEATNTTNVLYCYREVKTWQGPMFNMTDYLDEGCTYVLEADIFSLSTPLWASYQLQTTEDTAVGYGQLTGDSQSTTKISAGTWQHVSYTISVPDDMYYYALYFESYNGSGIGDIYIDNVTLTKTVKTNPDYTIASLAETYSDVFDIFGVGAGTDSILGDNGSTFIASQYNAVTPGNEMKPDALLGSSLTSITLDEAEDLGYYIPEDYASYTENQDRSSGEVIVPEIDFSTVDQIIEQCHEKGIKLRGHNLCWHEQTPKYFFTQNYRVAIGSKDSETGDYKYQVSSEVMDTRQEFFVKTVLSHVLEYDLELAGGDTSECVLYAYDAVNEYLHGGTADTNSDPTFWNTIYDTTDDDDEYMANTGVTLQPSYVKDTFTWAHEVLEEYGRTDVKLFYNDYNTYQYPEDIVHLIDYINSDGQVCDGIGMQGHLDISSSFHSADNFAKALACFQENAPDMEIQITELDATMESTQDNPLFDEDQAAYYDQIMGSILLNKKNGGNITGVILWSLYDGVSWRSAKYPCVFSGLYMPKSAYYALIMAKNTYWN